MECCAIYKTLKLSLIANQTYTKNEDKNIKKLCEYILETRLIINISLEFKKNEKIKHIKNNPVARMERKWAISINI